MKAPDNMFTEVAQKAHQAGMAQGFLLAIHEVNRGASMNAMNGTMQVLLHGTPSDIEALMKPLVDASLMKGTGVPS